VAIAHLRLACAFLAALTGCATRAWIQTQSCNTLYAYESFLKQHPGSRYAVHAWARLDTILLEKAVTRGNFEVYERFFGRYPVGQFADREHMESLYARRARDVGCPFAYEAYLREFPDGEGAEAARRDTTAIHRHLRALEAAATEGLPGRTALRASRELSGAAVPEYVVSAALIPGRDLDDGNPGHYFGSSETLVRAVHSRCLGVARAVAHRAALPAGAPLVIRIRQGIGLESLGFTSSHGRPMTIYAVAVPPEALASETSQMAGGEATGDETAVQTWVVRQNLIPEVTTSRPRRTRQ